MKFLVLFSMIFSVTAFASSSARDGKLMLLLDNEVVDAQSLANDGELSYVIDRDSKFCFSGSVDVVAQKIKAWNSEGEFFSGGGGGYTLESLKVTKKGIVGPKINLTIRSEVTGELEPTIYILSCKNK